MEAGGLWKQMKEVKDNDNENNENACKLPMPTRLTVQQ